MNNKQWLLWQMIDMDIEELSRVLSGRCHACVAKTYCKSKYPPNTAKPKCYHIIKRWLQQKHEDGDCK